MSINVLVEKLLKKVDYYLNNYQHSTIGEAYLKGEKGALLIVQEYLENGEIPEILKE